MLDGLTVGGYLPSSFLDWNGHVAAVIFTSGCNFRCPWCHNSTLVLSQTEPLCAEEVFKDILRRRNFLDGVVISGGEPFLWNGLTDLLMEIKSCGLAVKLDTNGSFPELLASVLEQKLVSYVAMDVKAPFDERILKRVTGAYILAERLRESISLIKKFAPDYEFRTTYVPALLTEEDLRAIRKELCDDRHWFVQCFKPVNCLNPTFMQMDAVSPEKLQDFLPGIAIRG